MMESEHKWWLVEEAGRNYGEIPYMSQKLRKNMRLLEKFFPDIPDIICYIDNAHYMVRPTEFMCLNYWLGEYGVDVLE